jgi:transcriptional regulator with XRE-family HTH domain
VIGNNADLAVGQRIADLRQQAGLRQEDLVNLLNTHGLDWTRTILSRVESGQRSLKATELFVVAQTLGISVDKLNPIFGLLPYEIEKKRAELRSAKSAEARASLRVSALKEELVPLILASEIRSGRSDYVVHGTPVQFVVMLMRDFYHRGECPFEEQTVNVNSILGFDQQEFLKLYQLHHGKLRNAGATLAQDVGLMKKNSYASNLRRMYKEFGKPYKSLFEKHYPLLRFVGDDEGPFVVDGLVVDDGG